MIWESYETKLTIAIKTNDEAIRVRQASAISDEGLAIAIFQCLPNAGIPTGHRGSDSFNLERRCGGFKDSQITKFEAGWNRHIRRVPRVAPLDSGPRTVHWLVDFFFSSLVSNLAPLTRCLNRCS